MTQARPPTAIAARRSEAATAALSEIDGRSVSTFRIAGGKHVGAIGPPEGATLERATRLAIEIGRASCRERVWIPV